MRFVLFFVPALLWAAAASAQRNGDPLLTSLRAGQGLAQFVGVVEGGYRRIVRNNPALTSEILAARREANAASQRAASIGLVLRNDLNGDLKITGAEFERAKLSGLDEGDHDQYFWPFDRNGDGVVDIREVTAEIGARPVRADASVEQFARLMSRQGGGPMDRRAVAAAAERTFKSADKNSDGVLDQAEFLALRPILPPR